MSRPVHPYDSVFLEGSIAPTEADLVRSSELLRSLYHELARISKDRAAAVLARMIEDDVTVAGLVRFPQQSSASVLVLTSMFGDYHGHVPVPGPLDPPDRWRYVIRSGGTEAADRASAEAALIASQPVPEAVVHTPPLPPRDGGA